MLYMLYIAFTGRHNQQIKGMPQSISGGTIRSASQYKPTGDLFNISFAKTKGRGVTPTNNIKFII